MSTVSRPKKGETEEDLLRFQEEFHKAARQDDRQLSSTVTIKKMTKKTNPMEVGQSKPSNDAIFELASGGLDKRGKKTEKRRDLRGGRFVLDLDVVREEGAPTVLFDVQERNECFLEEGSEATFCFRGLSDEYAKDDGFPDVLDLSRYFSVDSNEKLIAKDGCSYFAAEFDRLSGRINDVEMTDRDRLAGDESHTVAFYDEIGVENAEKIRRMDQEEILRAQREIIERFDPETVEFIRNISLKRQMKTKAGSSAAPSKESLFKRVRSLGNEQIQQQNASMEKEESEANVDVVVEEKVKQLEVINVDERHRPRLPEGCADSGSVTEEQSHVPPYSRLAAEAVQLDFATKCLRTVFPRQQRNILRLFDSLEAQLRDYTGEDELLKKARSYFPAIRGLYLDKKENGKGETYKFVSEVNPACDSAWTLVPIRKVLDTCQLDGKVTVNDVMVVRLALLWTFLLMSERRSLFYAFASPNEIYVRIAEVFIIGREVFNDDCVSECVTRILLNYVVPKAHDGHFSIALTDSIAELDAFLPFYEDLMKHFEEDSVGDALFSLTLLGGAYLNANVADSLQMRCLLWAPDRNIVRQITVNCQQGAFILEAIAKTRKEETEGEGDFGEEDGEWLLEHSRLMAMYAAAIRNDVVTADRNPLVYRIASQALGHFVVRHSRRVNSANGRQSLSAEKMKEFDVLVDVLRRTVAGKLNL